MRAVDVSAFNWQDKRPELIVRIKALQPQASNRAIAQAIGVDESTVRADQKPAGNPAPDAAKPAPVRDTTGDGAGNPAPEPVEVEAETEDLQLQSRPAQEAGDAEPSEEDEAYAQGWRLLAWRVYITLHPYFNRTYPLLRSSRARRGLSLQSPCITLYRSLLRP